MLLFLETSSQVYFALCRWKGESAGLWQRSEFPSVVAPQTAWIKHIQLQRRSMEMEIWKSSMEMAKHALPGALSLGRKSSGSAQPSLVLPRAPGTAGSQTHPGCVCCQQHLSPALQCCQASSSALQRLSKGQRCREHNGK